MIRVRASAPQPGAEGYTRHTAVIEAGTAVDDVWFMTPADTRPLTDDWLVPVGAVLGMVLGEAVHIEGRVSVRLLASMEEIQRIAVQRHDGLEHVRITAEHVSPTPPATRPRILSCLSCGVDAFHTALDPSERIDDFLYVHGFEAHSDELGLLARVLPHVRASAAELNKPLRLAETNWRSVIEPLTGHAYFVSVPMLFAIAYLMGSDVSRLVLPGTQDPDFPPDDPLSVCTYVQHWGTEGLETVETGHVPRLDKVRRLVESDVAMRHLRVCWNRDGVTYNCGRCEKCLRTRVNLKLANAEGRCDTLPPAISLREIVWMRTDLAAKPVYLDDNIEEAESRGLVDLAAALRVQREERVMTPTWWGAPREKGGRTLRRLRRSYQRRKHKATMRRLGRQRGDEHLFNSLGAGRLEDQV